MDMKLLPKSEVDKVPKTIYEPEESWCQTHIGVTEVSFTWVINNFSFTTDKPGESLESSVFWSPTNKSLKWRLQFYPSGNNDDNDEHMSLFLQLVSTDKPSIKTDFRFCLVDRHNQETNERKTSEKWYFYQGRQSGFPKFIRREYLLDPTNGLLDDDRLILRCKIKAATGFVEQTSQEMDKGDPTKLLSQLSNDLSELYQRKESSDVILESREGQQFYAHKIILAARSPVFSAMFAHDMIEKQKNIVHIDDVEAETLHAMLLYIYTGSIVDENDAAADGSLIRLLAVADKYALLGLKARCEQSLMTNLNVRMVCDCLVIAELCNAYKLKKKAMNFIRGHLSDVVQTPGFKSISRLNPMLLEDIIRSMTNS